MRIPALLIIFSGFILSGCHTKPGNKKKVLPNALGDTAIAVNNLLHGLEKNASRQLKDSFFFYGDRLIFRYHETKEYALQSVLYLRLYDSLYNWKDISKADEYLSQFIDGSNQQIADSTYRDNLQTALYYLGDDLSNAGQYFKSLNYFERYLVSTTKYVNQKAARIGFVNFSLGDIYVRLGDNHKALQYYSKAVKQYTALNDFERVAVATINLANCLNNYSKFDSAVAVTSAMDAVKTISKERKASLGMVKAEAFLRLNKPDEAQRIIAGILHLLDTTDHLRQYQVKQVLAEWYRQKGETGKAIALIRSSLDEALLHFRRSNIREAGKLYNEMGDCYNSLQKSDSAIYFFHRALSTVAHVDAGNIFSLPLKQELYAENTIMEALDAKAGWMANYNASQEKLKHWRCAVDCYDLSFEVERKLLLSFSYDESKIRMLKDSRQRSEKAITVCFKLYQETNDPQWIEKAFRFAERNKAFILLESIRRNMAASQLIQQDTLFQEVQQLQAQYAYAEKLLIEARNNNDTSRLKELEENKARSDEQLQLAQTSLHQNNSGYREWMEREDSISIAMSKSLLPDDQTALVEYFVGDAVSYAIIVTNKQPSWFVVIENSHMAAIDSFLFFFSDKSKILDDPAGYQQKANAVYLSWLLPCIEKFDGNKLLIVPDDRLALLPFEALVTSITRGNNLQSWSYLIKKYQVDMGYSALTLLKQEGIKKTNKGAVAFAPGFMNKERNRASLPFTFEEIDNIRNNKGDTRLYKQGDATLSRFRNLSPDLALIHIASHAGSDSANGTAAIEFADSTLLLHELYAMRLNADLVVLSACETGIGKIEKGEGAMSLARGFYYAGAKNIITSLWSINDQSTAGLFKDFYRHMNGRNFSDALHQSKMDYLSAELANDKYSPYYWAGFIYIGSEVANNRKKEYAWLWLTAAIFMLVSVLAYWAIQNKKGPAVKSGPGKLS